MKELSTSNFQGMSANNDSLLQIEEIVRFYANSKCLDRNVRWELFILAEHNWLHCIYVLRKGGIGTIRELSWAKYEFSLCRTK